MAEALVKTKKVGGSVMVTIPKEVVEHEHIMPGETVKLIVKKIKPDFFGIFPGITPFDKEKDRVRSKYE